MSELILLKSNDDIAIDSPKTNCYVYRIGAGDIFGTECIELGDVDRLNRIAEEIRDDYVRWTYKLKECIADAGPTADQLSLFFLTDLSCKRSEFFDSFDSICSLLYLHERLKDVRLERARLIGVDRAFAQGFSSLFVGTEVTVERQALPRAPVTRRLVVDGLFFGRTVGVWTVNQFKWNPRSRRPDRLERVFLSFYPQMFDQSGRETKYGGRYKNTDHLAVTVLSDGIHQKTSVGQYRELARQAEEKGFNVLDRDLRVSDIFEGLRWAVHLWLWYSKARRKKFVFKNIDISGFILAELRFSMSRITRLFILKGIFFRFFQFCKPDEVYYYPVEYPFGRMISWIAKLASPRTKRVGFQMGIVSNRRLEQFLAPGEASVNPPFYKHAPIPDDILAEDERAGRLYRSVGYHNVQVMREIHRYAYHSNIRLERKPGWALIAPGLHDGSIVLKLLNDQIVEHPEKTFIVKPHPRADNSYLKAWRSEENCRISQAPMEELFSVVSEVFVTYSSVGLEARKLGLKVTVLDIPGQINSSPLRDIPEQL